MSQFYQLRRASPKPAGQGDHRPQMSTRSHDSGGAVSG